MSDAEYTDKDYGEMLWAVNAAATAYAGAAEGSRKEHDLFAAGVAEQTAERLGRVARLLVALRATPL